MKRSVSSRPMRKVYEVTAYPPDQLKRRTPVAYEVIGTHTAILSYPSESDVRLVTVIYDNEDVVFCSEHVWTVRCTDFIKPKSELKSLKVRDSKDGHQEPSENS